MQRRWHWKPGMPTRGTFCGGCQRKKVLVILEN